MSKFIEIISDTNRAIVNVNELSCVYRLSDHVMYAVANNVELRFYFSNTEDVTEAMTDLMEKISE